MESMKFTSIKCVSCKKDFWYWQMHDDLLCIDCYRKNHPINKR
jgi:hypothetical protein